MSDSDFQEADEAVARAVTTFVSEIDQAMVKWEAVSPAYILESVLSDLCSELPKLADGLESTVGPATKKLLDALAEYQNSQAVDR